MLKNITLIFLVIISPGVILLEFDIDTTLLSDIIQDVLNIVYGVELFEQSSCPPVSDENIIIQLVSSDDPQNQYKFTPNDLTNLSHFNASLETKFLCHGWLADSKSEWLIKMRDSYLQKGNYNVFTVDWGKYSKNRYSVSKCFLAEVGKRVGNFIYEINKKNSGFNVSNVHFIGHSLGAHLLAQAAQTVQELTDKKIGRITGLDPAGPIFCHPNFKEADKRLSEDDAHFVDIIHTNGGVFGCQKKIGHTDFYPNCGKQQPGCLSVNVKLLQPTEAFSNFFSTVTCSHGRSHEIWIESIRSENFTAKECHQCSLFELGLCRKNRNIVMGENSKDLYDGEFYLSTANAPPFSKQTNVEVFNKLL